MEAIGPYKFSIDVSSWKIPKNKNFAEEEKALQKSLVVVSVLLDKIFKKLTKKVSFFDLQLFPHCPIR